MLLESLYFSRFLLNRPRPLSSFDTHAIAARNVASHADVLRVSSERVKNPLERLRGRLPVTQSARSRRSYGKIEGCEQASPRVDSKFFASVKREVMFSAPTTGTKGGNFIYPMMLRAKFLSSLRGGKRVRGFRGRFSTTWISRCSSSKVSFNEPC